GRADYRPLLDRSIQTLTSPPVRPGMVFDRTPLDYLAYLAATGVDPAAEVGPGALRSAFGSLGLLVLPRITAETEQLLPPAELPGLRTAMNEALLELAYDDPLDVWAELPMLELTGPLRRRPGTVR